MLGKQGIGEQNTGVVRSGGDCGGIVMVAQQILDEVTRRLVVGFHPGRIILFSSQARGTADARSDVDLLIICPVSGSRRELLVAIGDDSRIPDPHFQHWSWA